MRVCPSLEAVQLLRVSSPESGSEQVRSAFLTVVFMAVGDLLGIFASCQL